MPIFSKKSGGFTIAELIVTILIISVLASLAITKYHTAVERVRSAEGVQILEALLNAQKVYQFELNKFTSNQALLDIEIIASSIKHFNAPDITGTTDNALDMFINRSDGSYSLSINEDGVISCTDSGSGLCAKMQYN